MATEIWRHEPDGERYVVTHNYGRILAAAGPLHYSELDAALAGDFDNDEDTRRWLTDNPNQFNIERTA